MEYDIKIKNNARKTSETGNCNGSCEEKVSTIQKEVAEWHK